MRLQHILLGLTAFSTEASVAFAAEQKTQRETTSYTDEASSRGFADLLGYGRGAAFVDIDNDGDDDLFVVDVDDRDARAEYGISQLFLNDGKGNFAPKDIGISEDDIFATWSASFADWDNDGDQDLMLANGGFTAESTLVFYENDMQDRGRFINQTEAVGLAPFNEKKRAWWGVAWSDINKDGFLDAIVTQRYGQPLVLMNQDGKHFEDEASARGVRIIDKTNSSDHCETKNAVWFDYDSDGDEDLYIAGLACHFMFKNEAGRFTDITDEIFKKLPVQEFYSFAAAAADFNQDGKEDLYLGRWYEQDFVMYGTDNTQPQFAGTSIGLDMSTTRTPYENTMGLGVGDLFDDGYPDVVIGSGDPATIAKDLVFCNRQGLAFERCSSLFGMLEGDHVYTRGHGIVFSDIDNDGDTDWFFNLGGQPGSEPVGEDHREINRLYVASGNPHTAHVKLQGVISSRDAIGARITVKTDPPHYYTVRTTQGFQSQNSNTLLISLDDDELTDVEIVWPAGTRSSHSIKSGGRYALIEPSAVK